MKTGGTRPLDHTEAKFATVFRVCPDFITITNCATSRYIEVNDAFTRIMGYPKADVIGRTALEVGIWETAHERQRMLEALTDSTRLENFEVRIRRADGVVIDSLLSVERANLGGEDCLIIVGRDISDRKRVELLLRGTAAELRRSNAELEQFAYVASHDLREPLRMVSSYVAMLERRYGDLFDDDARDFIGFVREGAQRMDRMVLDLLEYSRIGRLGAAPAPTSLADVVDGALDALRLSSDEASASITVAGTWPVVTGSRGELVRLFQNLIGNALKYRHADRQPVIRITCQDLENAWQIAVSDNGIGIAAEYFERIFAIFQRLHTRDKYDGTGIGLAICKKIVEHHGGRIWVESIAGEGTTFFFTLRHGVPAT